jgi:hypothetical protein
VLLVGVGRASAAGGSWVSTATGCPSGVGTPCYVFKSPTGVVVEGGKYLSVTEFETLTPEVANAVIEGDHLAPAAKSYMEVPANVQDAIAASADAPGAAAAGEGTAVGEAIVEGSGEIPILAPLAALGAGIGIGSKICGWLGIEGCWFSENTETQPPAVQPGSQEWKFFAQPSMGSAFTGSGPWPLIPYSYYLFQAPFGILGQTLQGHGGVPAGCSGGTVSNSGTGTFIEGGGTGATVNCGSGAENLHVHETVQARLGSKGKRSGFESAAAASSLPAATGSHYCQSEGCTATPATNWPTEMAKNMTEPGRVGLSRIQGAAVAQYVSHKVAGTTLPGEFTTTVPGCEGLSYTQCVVKLEEAALTPAHHELGWSEAITADPPQRVEELSPARSTQVEKHSTVVVTTNPNESGMPVIVPAPGANETYAQYIAKLNPALAPHEHILGELNSDPAHGPNAVTSTSPAAGTRVNPATSTSLDVQVNPSTASDPVTSSTWSPPTIAPIDLSPFKSVHIGCSSFPFGIFCWLKDGLTSWGPGGTCPSINLPFVAFGSGEDHFSGAKLESSTCGFEPAMEIIRPMLIVLATLSLAAMFAYAALGIGGPAGSDD